MLDDDGNFSLGYINAEAGVIRFDVKSRNINKKIYKCYVQYNGNIPGYDAMEDHCCNGPNELRTTGSCSHIAALIYHLSKNIRPAEVLTTLFDIDNVC